jgi:hypothetical protein
MAVCYRLGESELTARTSAAWNDGVVIPLDRAREERRGREGGGQAAASVSLMDFNGETFSCLDTALRGGEPEGEELREGATRQGGEMANRSAR